MFPGFARRRAPASSLQFLWAVGGATGAPRSWLGSMRGSCRRAPQSCAQSPLEGVRSERRRHTPAGCPDPGHSPSALGARCIRRRAGRSSARRDRGRARTAARGAVTIPAFSPPRPRRLIRRAAGVPFLLVPGRQRPAVGLALCLEGRMAGPPSLRTGHAELKDRRVKRGATALSLLLGRLSASAERATGAGHPPMAGPVRSHRPRDDAWRRRRANDQGERKCRSIPPLTVATT
jgi:hypothetical protein